MHAGSGVGSERCLLGGFGDTTHGGAADRTDGDVHRSADQRGLLVDVHGGDDGELRSDGEDYLDDRQRVLGEWRNGHDEEWVGDVHGESDVGGEQLLRGDHRGAIDECHAAEHDNHDHQHRSGNSERAEGRGLLHGEQRNHGSGRQCDGDGGERANLHGNCSGREVLADVPLPRFDDADCDLCRQRQQQHEHLGELSADGVLTKSWPEGNLGPSIQT